jgi:hypothetical protein
VTEHEAALREFIFRLNDFARRLRKAEDDAGALDQMVKLITPGLGFGAPAAVTHTSTLCGGIDLPDTLNVVDSLYGNTTVTWDGTNWTGCHAGLFFPATGATFALHYRFTPAGGGDVSVLANGSQQPIASTCATATNENNLGLANTSTVCPPSPFSRTFTISGSSSLALKTLYQIGTTQTVTFSA